ncbi:Mg(2+) transporter [Aspergillus nanangensis]|uniref:Mg(2+) transporter n=1 Tax=Aspergillus nanangensis TaxID=2582783 RepID=A0AAD4CBQ4_ASPNN|nr:Mg(2+) transporter [Aspergillus nanangensis]
MRPKISHLHFGATVSAIALYCVISLADSSQGFADTTDLASLPSENQSNLAISNEGSQLIDFPLGSYNGLVIEKADDDTGEARGLDLVRRAPNGAPALDNNQYKDGGVKRGETQWWYVPKEVVDGKRANDSSDGQKNDVSKRWKPLYLSLTACSKPDPGKTGSDQKIPQLELYVSTSDKLQKPGPGGDSSNQALHTAEQGYVGINVQAEGDVYIGVTAPNSTEYSGSYTYQIAVSIDSLFHKVEHEEFLFLVDADTHTALLTSDNLTASQFGVKGDKELMNMTTPFTIFANNVNNTATDGLQRSYCALKNLAQIRKGDQNIQTGMTTRGLNNRPKQQFYLKGLNKTSTYTGILARDDSSVKLGNGIVGGGGTVYMPRNFNTKTEDNCAVLYDLSFCSEVAYAVPSNPNMEVDKLRTLYDDHAASLYKNFTYSLDQVQCNTSNETRYSLAVDCNQCATAYKQWLCAVTIPRCADFSNPAEFLHPRNVGQSFDNNTQPSTNNTQKGHPAFSKSRNPLIDSQINPGPYKEILPCQDVCYNLVKKCPSVLGFQCPEGRWLDWSYGKRDGDGNITCSYLGAAYFLSHGESLYQTSSPLYYAWTILSISTLWLIL